MSSLGDLVVHLAANTAEFSDDLGRAAHIADKNMKSISDAATKAGIAIQAMALASAVAMIGFGKAALDSADSMGKMAQSAGMSSESFSELAYAASLADVDVEQFQLAMVKLNKSTVEASKGTLDAKVAYQALGISIRDSHGELKSGESLLGEVADRFAAMQDGTAKTTLAVELFGRAGAKLIPMLNEGSAGLQKSRDEAKAFGLSIGEDAAKAAEKFNDNLTRLNAIQRGFSQEMAAAVVGPLTDFEEQLIAAAKSSDIFSGAGQVSTTVLQTLSIVGANVAYVFKAVGNEIGGLVAQVAAAGRGDFKGFTAIGDQMKEDAETARKGLDEFENKVMGIGQGVKTSYEEVGKAAKLPPPDLSLITAIEKLNQQKLEDARKLGEDQYKVELDSYTELQKLRQDGAHEDALWAQKKVDALVELGEAQYKIEIDSFGELENLRGKWRQDELDTHTKFAQAGLDQIHEQLSTETQLQGDHYADQLARLIEARDLGLITEQQYADQYAGIAQDNADKIAMISSGSNLDIEKFRKMSLQRQLTSTADFFVDMTSAVANGNRFLFNINKIASISSAALKGYQAVINSYEVGTELGGPVVGAAFAAVAGVATAAMIAQIAGTQYGSGSAPSSAGSAGAPVSPVAPSPIGPGSGGGQSTIIKLVGGDTFSKKQVRELIEKINEESVDGGRLVIA